jgi:hypothetical protein
MTSSRLSPKGQSLLETVLVLPMLLGLLAGGYWAFRHFSYSGSAESASQAHLLRTGRSLGSIEPYLLPTIGIGNEDIHLRKTDAPVVAAVPLFRGMTGRTVVSADVRSSLDSAETCLKLPSHSVRREAEAAVDCWGKETGSGAKIRRTVGAVVLTGWIR